MRRCLLCNFTFAQKSNASIAEMFTTGAPSLQDVLTGQNGDSGDVNCGYAHCGGLAGPQSRGAGEGGVLPVGDCGNVSTAEMSQLRRCVNCGGLAGPQGGGAGECGVLPVGDCGDVSTADMPTAEV
jgi:hypothetical protein